MNSTIKELIALVKGMTKEEARVVVDQYFNTDAFDLIIDEYNNRMSEKEKDALIERLINFK